jgi:hypothetical protein
VNEGPFQPLEGLFTFAYTLSQEEYVEYTLYTYNRTEFHRGRILTNRLVRAIFCSSVAGAFNFLLSGSWIAGCISFAAVAVGGWFLEGLFWRWQIGRIYKRDKTLQQQASIEISEAGVGTVRGGALGYFPWPSITCAVQTDNALYLYLGSLQGLVLPRRLFADQASFTAFGRFALQRAGHP